MVDLGSLIATVWERRWWLVISLAASVALFVAVTILTTKLYRASTVVVVANTTSGLSSTLSSALGSLGGLASLAGIDLNGSNGRADEIVAVLQSRQLIEKFLREKDLLPVLYADDWDLEAKAWKSERRERTYAQAHKYFTRKVMSVVRERSSGLITVAIEWKNGEQAATWANELVERVNAEVRTRDLSEVERSIGFLEQELKRTTVVTAQEAIGRVMENQINQRMLANVSSEYALRVIDRALPPDPRDPVRPRKLLLLASGIACGGTVGLFLIWFVPVVRQARIAHARNRNPD